MFSFLPPVNICYLICAAECEQMRNRCTRLREGGRNELFRWPLLQGCAPVVRVATAAATYGALFLRARHFQTHGVAFEPAR